MPFKNYYHILSVLQNCQLTDIKRAYRTLALKYHPDRNKDTNAEQKFIEITEAYEVLRDSIKRKEYDDIYDIYFSRNNDLTSKKEQTHFSEDKQASWSQYGQEKAKEYASVPFNEFARRMLKEVSVGVNYVPNIIALIITTGCGLSCLLTLSPKMFRESIPLGIFSLVFVVLMFFISFKLFEVAKADYIQERKRNNF